MRALAKVQSPLIFLRLYRIYCSRRRGWCCFCISSNFPCCPIIGAHQYHPATPFSYARPAGPTEGLDSILFLSYACGLFALLFFIRLLLACSLVLAFRPLFSCSPATRSAGRWFENFQCATAHCPDPASSGALAVRMFVVGKRTGLCQFGHRVDSLTHCRIHAHSFSFSNFFGAAVCVQWVKEVPECQGGRYNRDETEDRVQSVLRRTLVQQTADSHFAKSKMRLLLLFVFPCTHNWGWCRRTVFWKERVKEKKGGRGARKADGLEGTLITCKYPRRKG